MLLQASCSLRSAGAKYRSPLAPASRPAVGARRVRRLAAAADETQPTPVDAAAVSIDAVTVESSSPVPQAAEARESFMPQGSAAESNALEQARWTAIRAGPPAADLFSLAGACGLLACLPGPEAACNPCNRYIQHDSSSAHLPQEELDLLPEDEGEPTLSQSVQTLWDKPLVKGAVVTAGAFLGITFAISVYKAWRPLLFNASMTHVVLLPATRAPPSPQSAPLSGAPARPLIAGVGDLQQLQEQEEAHCRQEPRRR